MKGQHSGDYPPMLGCELLTRRCKLGVPLTFHDITAWHGVSRQRVMQIHDRALRKLRLAIARRPELRAELEAMRGRGLFGAEIFKE